MAALNVLSLMLYIDEIRIILQHGVLHILALNKTRLGLSIPNELVNVDDYDIIRSDRNRSWSWSLCLYEKGLNFSNRLNLVPENLEADCLEVNKPMSRHFVVSAIYGPPNTPIELILKIDKFIGKLDDDYEEMYILGDLDCI